MRYDFDTVHFGIFDSLVNFGNIENSKKRRVGFFEFELFTSPSQRLSFVDEVPIKRERGTLICAKPGQIRYSQLPFRCHYLHISSDDNAFISLMESLPDVITIHDTDQIIGMYEEVLKYEGDSPEEIFGRHSAVCKLLGFILHCARIKTDETNPALLTYGKTLIKVADYIKHHLSEKLSLEMLADMANLSPIYFHKLFSERFGKTPGQYISEHRISAAKLALLSENVSILEVAEACGFSTQSYFNNRFKEVTGLTPLQYRKKMLGRLKV